MIAEMRTLTCQRTIQAPLDQVYRAFTNAQALREWFCDVATVVPRIGGRVYLRTPGLLARVTPPAGDWLATRRSAHPEPKGVWQ